MIKLADSSTAPYIRKMWLDCFHDSPEFMDLYFSEKYKNENTLLYEEDEKPVASLQLLPYQFSFYGKEVSSAYISGACTLPEYRKRGYMGRLLNEAFRLMHSRNIPISILIPAEDWLYGYYARYGYAKVFEKGNAPVLLSRIAEWSQDEVDRAYTQFDALFRNKDFCVQKTKEDFVTIMKEMELEHFQPKTNLAGMARIIDAEYLLEIFAGKHQGEAFEVQVKDEILEFNSGRYRIERGSVVKSDILSPDLQTVDVQVLCKYLMGISDPLTCSIPYFAPHSPVMNLMLE